MTADPRPMAPAGRAAAAAAALTVVAGLLAAPASARSAEPSATQQSSVIDQGAEVVLRALSLLGVDYRWGGNTAETGLDCSGLVRLVFHESLGLVLPRRSEEMSRTGSEIRAAELRPGDLVFFNTLRRAFSHVGIYIGNNQFVHAPATGGAVRVERIAGQWGRLFFAAPRRLLAMDAGPGAQASRLPAPAGRAAVAAAAQRAGGGPRPNAWMVIDSVN
jgi:cell wall-associated NlpC family hydrolase